MMGNFRQLQLWENVASTVLEIIDLMTPIKGTYYDVEILGVYEDNTTLSHQIFHHQSCAQFHMKSIKLDVLEGFFPSDMDTERCTPSPTSGKQRDNLIWDL